MRKNQLIISTLLVILICPLFADFFGDTVHTVRVYFDDPDFWETLDSTHETEEYIMCSVVFDAVDSLDSVGIRLKGNSSYSHPGDKKPFHLKLDEYIDGQDHKGNERLSFNNCFRDPSFLREKLGCEVFHGLGVPCPRACWSEVYYNDEYWGFYSTTDPINKEALDRFFSYDDGNLYDCERNATMEWRGSSISNYENLYLISANEDADDYIDLIDFFDFLNNTDTMTFGSDILDRFDAIGFARVWAANTFLVNLDSYQGFGRNYYFYFDYDTVGRYIVYDLNMAFGGFNQYGFTPTELRELPIDWYATESGPPPGTPSERPLARRCFEEWTPFWGLVYNALDELLSTTLDTATFNARVTELADLVRPYVYADSNKQYTDADFETNLDDDIVFSGPHGFEAIPGLRNFIEVRAGYLGSEIGEIDRIDVEGAVLINEVMPSNGTTIADENAQFEDWFELYNPADTTIDISYWWVSDDFDEPRKWSFPNGTTIPAHGYLLVWADSDPEQGDLHTNFKLDADGESVSLSGPDFYGNGFCDSVSWADMPTDSSWGRFPNGSVTWQVCLESTPGTENVWSTLVDEPGRLPAELSLTTYPNPFNSAVRIIIGGFLGDDIGTQSIRTQVFDLTGNLVDELQILTPEDLQNDAISLIWSPQENLGSGTYFIRVQVGDKISSGKIMYLK